MRIVLDLQACQNEENNLRGIGRYALAFAKAIARRAHDHEVIVSLNGNQPSIDAIKSALDGLIPPERFSTWFAPPGTAGIVPGNAWRARASELVREHAIAMLDPDIVHVASLFEGLHTDITTSIKLLKGGHKATLTHYDLIPALNPDIYLPSQVEREWYQGKLDSLRRSDLCMCISEHTRRELIDVLGVPEERAATILAASEDHFRPVTIDDAGSFLAQFGIFRPFVMYSGGFDRRKNIDRLIQAYSALPPDVRQKHQIVVVGALDRNREDLLREAMKKNGLRKTDYTLTGYVSDEDLVKLYNLCTLYVMPSLHEGFGLPVLEAMKCGAAVVCSNATSLPEVMRCDDALFDPLSVQDMSRVLLRSLTDAGFREHLKAHGLERSKEFSWDECARRAMDAFEDLYDRRSQEEGGPSVRGMRPRLAWVLPELGPSGRPEIHLRQLDVVKELSSFYDVTLVLAGETGERPADAAPAVVRSLDWFSRHASEFERIVYHLGSSDACIPLFDLIDEWPGIVVLHDFFLGPSRRRMEERLGMEEAWTGELYRSHGYGALMRRAAPHPSPDVLALPCNGSVVDRAGGMIVHSQAELDLAAEWHGKEAAGRWRKVALAAGKPGDRIEARNSLGLSATDFVVCLIGDVDEEPVAGRASALPTAFRALAAPTTKVLSVATGPFLPDEAGDAGIPHPRFPPDGRSPEAGSGRGRHDVRLAASDVVVHCAHTPSSASRAMVLDAMAGGLPVVFLGDEGGHADFPDDAKLIVAQDSAADDLPKAVALLREDAGLRARLGDAGRRFVAASHTPAASAASYRDAVEAIHERSQVFGIEDLARRITRLQAPVPSSDADVLQVVGSIAANRRPERDQRQLLLDISELVQRDAKTGIQRVVRSLLFHLMTDPPAGFRVEPVHFDAMHRMRYARKFASRFSGFELTSMGDVLVDLNPGDVFVGLDLQIDKVVARTDVHRRMKAKGVRVHYVVYDLLPALHPEWFVGDIRMGPWIEAICSASDGIVCISRTVGRELEEWLPKLRSDRVLPLRIGHFHLGDDLDGTDGEPGPEPALPFPPDEPSFLMVGTVEIRKGHEQALLAFERLWSEGVDAHLVIAGKLGWKVERLVERMRGHPELGRRLHWFESASDALLLRLYKECWALLAASRGEGFGLPLIEAAKYSLPIVARDLPVFREIAGDHAMYFSGEAPEDLAATMRRWLAARRNGTVPDSSGMRRLTWKQASQALMEVVLGGRWDSVWVPGQPVRTVDGGDAPLRPAASSAGPSRS